MKKFRKWATALSLALILVLGGIGLAACNDPDPTTPPSISVSESLKTDAENVLTIMKENVVNKLTKVDLVEDEPDPNNNGTYTVAEAQAEIEEFVDYYVLVGTLSDVSDLTSVGFGDTSYSKDQTIPLSVGNNKFITDKVYYVEDSKLFMAAPIVLVESAGQSKIKLNGTEVDFNVNPAVEPIEFTDVRFCFETTNTITKDENTGVYTATYNEAAGKSMLGFYYEGNAKNDLAVNRLYKNGALNSYSITFNTDVDKDGAYPITYYFLPWTASGDVNEINAERHQDARFELKSYIQGKGVATATVIDHINYTDAVEE